MKALFLYALIYPELSFAAQRRAARLFSLNRFSVQ
jgi:hypothetical protein